MRPVPGSFFDTNILIYLASDNKPKADQAEKLIAAGGTISVQVLNEIANVARRKLNLSWTETTTFLTTIRTLLTVLPVTIETHDTGIALAQRFGFSIYDAMIVAAALGADCTTLWSEDMHHGLLINKRMRIVNPFQSAPRE